MLGLTIVSISIAGDTWPCSSSIGSSGKGWYGSSCFSSSIGWEFSIIISSGWAYLDSLTISDWTGYWGT